MGIQLEQVVPWGRSLHEYRRMFSMTPVDLQKTILDCGSGPASFNAEITQQGGRVISCDPIYQFSVEQIQQRIDETYDLLLEKVQASLEAYLWHDLGSPEQMGQLRMAAMQQFFQDFPQGLQAGRYQVATLPTLPYRDRQFDLALCSHLLFTYSDHLSEAFHLQAIEELCRVAAEVRIFPLLKVSGEPSPFVPGIVESLRQRGDRVEIVEVNYEFQKGGHQMLSIRRGQK
jgi:SAM-dependent methyltransferase